MKKIKEKVKRISWKGTTQNHGEAIRLINAPGDIALVERGRPRSIVCMCPCGCGTSITLNLDRRTDKAWILYRRNRGYSLYPSVWRDSGCKSHFIIWNNRILWLEDDWWTDEYEIEELSDKILPLIQKSDFIPFREIADLIDEVPWTVLRVCKELARNRKIEEGIGDSRGSFRKL